MRAARAALMLIAIASVTASGQGNASAGARKMRSALTINPLGLPAEYVSAEFETMVSDIMSFGISGSYFGPGDVNYASVEAKLRLYPNEEGPKGFSVGIAGGVTHVSETFSDGPKKSASRPSIGVVVDYNWILGKKKKVLVGSGVGMKRLLGDEGDFQDVNFFYPTVRFQIGVRF